jgi:hypothetical protein
MAFASSKPFESRAPNPSFPRGLERDCGLNGHKQASLDRVDLAAPHFGAPRWPVKPVLLWMGWIAEAPLAVVGNDSFAEPG